MKKGLIILVASLMTATVFAQSEKYTKAMEALVPAVDTTRSIEVLTDLANSFERIANAEKTQWLPFYYAAFSHVMKGYYSIGKVFGENTDVMDEEANKAEELLNLAEKLSGENSETLCIKNMIAGLRIMTNPAVNGMKYGPIAEEYLMRAKTLDPNNPRPFLLDGQSAIYKPEEWGGGKEKAKNLLNIAFIKYNTFKPVSTIYPNWGKNLTVMLLEQLKKG